MTTLTGRAKELFLDALEVADPVDRRAFLDRSCGADAALRAEVEDLLAHHGRLDSFLATPSADPAATATLGATAGPTAAPDDPPGTAVGPYLLLEPIGEGGFGLVYVAEQSEPVRRRVALKVLKPGMDTREVVARFEAERQALALMDHPHIARVFDAGATPAGRPYFVMELVRGVPITRHCDDRRLPVRDRLGLFADLCGAVQHAHQKGVIHRDLKPTNVLVAEADGKPVVKVIDFGIARAAGPGLTDKTVYTRFAQMIGITFYMSPEQAGGGPDVDTRSDVYSLGVVLYELLTGATPFDADRLRGAGYDELRRLIREEEPARPSARLSTLAQAATASAHRGTDPRKLSRLVRGDLDWVVMRALEKDRNRRYESAGALAADVGRFLADEPVLARPPSAAYRARKFARRNRAAVLTASAVAAALVVGLVGTVWGLVRATTAEAAAKDEARQKADALTAEGEALTEAQDQLFAGLVSKSRAVRVSGRIGQRFEALNAVRKAAAIRATPELRDDATAALVLPDLELAREWDGWPDGTVWVCFDAAFGRYARLDRPGELTVCKLTDAGEEVVARLPAHGGPLFGPAAVSPDGRFVAYAHTRVRHATWAGVRVWRLDGPAPAVLLDDPDGVYESALAFHPDGRQLAVGHPDRALSVYDLTTGRRVHRLALADRPIRIDFHPREHKLAVAGGPDVQLFDTDAGRELPRLRRPADARGTTYSVAWHPDGRRLATGGDRRIRVWDADAAVEVTPPWAELTTHGVQVRFNHAGDRLVSIDWSGRAVLWEAATGRRLLTSGYSGMQFSPDGRLLGYSVSGTKLQLWRPAFGREFWTLRRRGTGPQDTGVRLAVHPDGRTVAVGDETTLAFFDLPTGEELGFARQSRPWASLPLGFAPPDPSPAPDPGGSGGGSGLVTGGLGGLLRWPARADPARR
ncbi:MAG: protein kinase, partial [Gemmataceae bacterium]|nr:protein kinase [Gemmataceae bacterium]